MRHGKTPITYYGGKQSMLPHILPIIPEHTCYVEPFFGGGAVFFSKQPATLEIINDTNSEVMNFFFCLKLHFEELNDLVQSTDALRVIRSRDQDGGFMFVDPPYFNSDCGHYGGYTEEDFKMLLEALSGLKSKFLLSSYPSDILREYMTRQGWYQMTFDKHLSAAKQGKRKVEVLTANYPIG